MDNNGNHTSPLGEWVKAEATKRGWSMREVARRTRSVARPEGFTNTTISDIAKGSATTPDVCRGLAHAFEVEPEYVMQLAGILADRGEILPEVRSWSDELRGLTPERRSETIAAMERVLRLVRPLQQDRAESQTGR